MINKKVVVMGGGHGQSALLRGIKQIDNIDITTIVTVADDGGSTGRLRQYFAVPAMGDIRGVMLSLAEDEGLLASLMNYRFVAENDEDIEKDVMGHNLGNLILLALMKSSGDFVQSIKTISKVLNVKGEIIPSSSQLITLYARMEDDTIVKGEANIPNIDNRISKVFYDEVVKASTQAIEAILSADLIIYGVGSIYTSILPNVIIPEIKEALNKSRGMKVYFCNAMSQPGETSNYSMEDHVDALESHGAIIERVIVASDEIPDKLIRKYQDEGSTKVICKSKNYRIPLNYEPLLSFADDLIRHDALKVKRVVEKLLSEIEV
ncbi:MAG: uridine diphosphate-N-acetylglucosamine-binding protein YvcK [Anaerorhabdus sp.]